MENSVRAETDEIEGGAGSLERLIGEIELQPVVDVTVALDYALNDRELLRELVLRYMEVTEERIRELRQAGESEAMDQIRRTAHSMKGGSYYVGAMRMISVVQALQLEERLDRAVMLIRLVEAEFLRLRTRYQELDLI